MKWFVLFAFVFLMGCFTTTAQNSFIKKLPIRGVPAKMIATSDGGYACLAATDFVNQQFNRISLIKCDANGDTMWMKKYSLNDSSAYFPKSLIETQTGNFVIVSVFSDYPLLNYGNGVVYFTDANGNKLWSKVFFDTASASVTNSYTKLVSLSASKVSVLGGVFPIMFLHTLDHSGNLIAINTLDTFSYGYSNLNLDTNNYPIFSRVMPPNQYNRQNIYKTDAFYNHIIDKNYICVKGQFADVNRLDNGLAYLNYNGDTIIKLDGNLDSTWARTVTNYYAPGFTTQRPTDFKATSDGGYVMCGNISNAIAHLVFLLKTDSLANTEFRQIYFGAVVDNVVSVEQAADGGFVMLQSGNPDTAGITEMWLVKTDSAGMITGVNEHLFKEPVTLTMKVSPNPASNKIKVVFNETVSGNLELFDNMGKSVMIKKIKSSRSTELLVANLKSAIYRLMFIDKSTKEKRYAEVLITRP